MDCLVLSIQDLGDSILDFVLPPQDSSTSKKPVQHKEIKTDEKIVASEIESEALLQRSKSVPVPSRGSNQFVSQGVSNGTNSRQPSLPSQFGRDTPQDSKKFIPAWRRENMDHRKNLRKKLEGTVHLRFI